MIPFAPHKQKPANGGLWLFQQSTLVQLHSFCIRLKMLWRKILTYSQHLVLGATLLGLIGSIAAYLLASHAALKDFLPWLAPSPATLLYGYLLWCLLKLVGSRPWWQNTPLVLTIPGALVLFIIARYDISLPDFTPKSPEINRVTLTDGRTFMLAYDRGSHLDITYALWQADESGPSPKVNWRRPDPVWPEYPDSWVKLNYSSGNKFTENPALLVTPDQHFLLVRRGGIWTDCMITSNPLRNCRCIDVYPSQIDRQEWHDRSEAITQLTGFTPEGEIIHSAEPQLTDEQCPMPPATEQVPQSAN